jgi:hypothetical protein
MNRDRNPSTVGRRKTKRPVELLGVLSTIATVLEAPRDRLGRLDIEHGTAAGDARETLRSLALAFDVQHYELGDHGDILEMCSRVAKAAVERAQR